MTPAQATCLSDALVIGYAILEQGGPAVIAVECTIGLLEQSGLFNAGEGANRQLDGVQRMDASIMEGAHLKAGAIASIEGILHPITAARLVMEATNHVLLAGPPRRLRSTTNSNLSRRGARFAGVPVGRPPRWLSRRRWSSIVQW